MNAFIDEHRARCGVEPICHASRDGLSQPETDPTPRELAELYTPTEDEQRLAAGVGKRAFIPISLL